MKLIPILSLLLLLGCTKPNHKERDTNFPMDCEYVAGFIERCENIEVVCYKYHEAMQCKFKERKQ